VSSFTKHQAS